VRIVGRETNGTGQYRAVLTGTAFSKACSGGPKSWRLATDGTGRYWSVVAGTALLNACSVTGYGGKPKVLERYRVQGAEIPGAKMLGAKMLGAKTEATTIKGGGLESQSSK
jgi:hypothetical protein